MRRFLPLVFLLAALASGAPGWSAVRVVDDPTGSDANNPCDTEANACATLEEALGQLTSGSGHTVRVCNGAHHRGTELAETGTNGTAANKNVITGFNCTTIRNSTVRPKLGMTRLITSGWVQCSAGGSNCAGGVTSANVWRIAHGRNAHMLVLQDADKQGQTHLGFTNEYDGQDETTHHLRHTGWHPRRANWANINGTCPACSGTACDACNQTCPNHLNADHEYCWDNPGNDATKTDGQLYLFSTSNPGTRYTNPGIEVGDRTTAGNFLTIQHDHWTVENLDVRGTTNRPMLVRTHPGKKTITGVILRNMDLSYNWPPQCFPRTNNGDCDTEGWESGSAILYLSADHADETISNLLIDNVVCHDTGRDCMAFAGPGTITGVTTRNVEAYNIFAHPFITVNHFNFGQEAEGGLRTNLVFEDLNVHQSCGVFSMGSGGLADFNVQADIRRLYVHDNMTEETDPRIQLRADCGAPSGMVGVYVDSVGPGPVTVDRAVLVRNAWGAVHHRANANLTITNTTFGNHVFGAVSTDRNGGTITHHRNLFHNNGNGTAVGGSSHEIGSRDFGASTNTVFAGSTTAATQSRYFHAGSSNMAWRGASKTLATWITTANVNSDDGSSVGAIGFVDPGTFATPAGNDWNLSSTSAVDNLAAVTAAPFCGAGRELGGLERPEIDPNSLLLVDSDTIEFRVCAISTPIQLTCTRFTPTVAGTARTASGCTVLTDGVTGRLNFSGAAATPATPVTLTASYDAIRTATQVGGTNGLRGKHLAFGPLTVQNGVVTPSPTTCTVADASRDKATVCFAGGVSPMLPATNCTGISMAFDADFTLPWTQEVGGCDRSGTECFLIDNTTDAEAGQTPFIRYETTGNITDSTPLEPAAFTLPCTNNIIPSGTLWFVNGTTGSDSNTCTQAQTAGTAKATIAGGIGCLTAGGTLEIAAGTYAESINNTVPNGVSWANPTTVRAAAGATVIVQPTGAAYALLISGTEKAPAFQAYQDLIFDGTNSTLGVVRVGSGAGTIRLTGGQIRSGSGVGFSLAKTGTGPTTTAVEITGTAIHSNTTGGINVTGSGNTLLQLSVHDNGTYGINVTSDSGNVNDNTVSHSASFSNGTAGLIVGGGATTRVVNTLSYSNLGNGLQIDATATGALVEHLSATLNGGTGVLNAGATSTIRNTIAFGNTTAQLTDSGTGTTLTTNLTTDPLFTNAATGDLSLQAGSAAVDTGTTLAAVVDDFAGVTRPVGAAYDIGAFERDVPDTTPPSRPGRFPIDQVFAAGTTSVAIGHDTNENATCKWGTVASQAFADKPNTFTTTDGLQHRATLTGLSDGDVRDIHSRCQDVSLNTNTSDIHMTFSIALVAPTITQCFTTDVEPSAVYCDANDGGNGPLIPQVNCATAGWTCEKNAGTGRTETDCDIDASSRIKLTLADSLVSGDTATCAYSQATGDITNAGGTQELTAGTFVVDNQVDAPPPPTDGVLTQTTARIGRAGCGTDPFSAACTIVDGVQDAVGKVFPGSVHQLHVGFTCATNDCPTAAHVFQACDSINCTSSDPNDANWYTVTDDCDGRLVCYGDDPSVGNLADTGSSLSGCVRAAGVVYKKGGGGVFTPVTLTAGQCATYLGVLQLSPAATVGQFTDLRLVKDGGGHFSTYTTLGRLQAITTYATR